MSIWRVCRTRIYSEWAEVEAASYEQACEEYEKGRWIGNIGEESDTEWDVEVVDDEEKA